MTAYESLRTAIAAELAAVTNVGTVHNRERFVVDPSQYLDLFKATIGGVVQIRGWQILREAATAVEMAAFDEVRRRHEFVLYGVLGFADSADTYGTWQAMADTIMARFDDLTTLSTPGVIVYQIGPCSLRSFRTEQFGSVLCHAAEIVVPIETMLPTGTA